MGYYLDSDATEPVPSLCRIGPPVQDLLQLVMAGDGSAISSRPRLGARYRKTAMMPPPATPGTEFPRGTNAVVRSRSMLAALEHATASPKRKAEPYRRRYGAVVMAVSVGSNCRQPLYEEGCGLSRARPELIYADWRAGPEAPALPLSVDSDYIDPAGRPPGTQEG